MTRLRRFLLLALLGAAWAAPPVAEAAPAALAPPQAAIALENRAGLRWEFSHTGDGWALGSLSLHGKPIEHPATRGLLAMRNVKTGDVRWLAASQGQQPSGVFHTSYYFRKEPRGDGATAEGFCSWDWHHNGYKVDINAWMVRYILQTWQRTKEHEGVDRQDWHKAAMRNVEGRFWYTGAHPDLPPGDFEQDSIYAVVEYWLDKHDRTGDRESLDRAVANAYYALLYWCPKQLSWVRAPTQCAHSEQQHFNQYSVYCYGNRKIQCLDRLFKKTGNRLFEQLRNRVMQLNFYTQVADGPYRGAVTEAIADPWLQRGGGFQWRGSPYTSELVADLMLQLIDLGLVKKPGGG